MDSLQKVPVAPETTLSPRQKQIIDQYFPSQDEDEEQVSTHLKWNWKKFLVIIIWFILLNTPMFDSLLCKIPYCGEGWIYAMILKTILFVMVLGLAEYFYP